VSDERVAALVAQVGSFHITDRAMRKAQDAAAQAVANGSLDSRVRDDYLTAVRRYFAAFEREARGHLRDVDRRLEHVNQVHFNLAAERGVAVKRIEATQAVLAELDAIGVEHT
jgi:imidazolonepropionase-like amidohydrolase